MQKHIDGPECPECSFKLGMAHPVLQDWFDTIIKPAFPDCHISWSWRGREDQMTFFKLGKSGVPWPRSRHNVVDHEGRPCSEALDLFRQGPAGEYIAVDDDMRRIYEFSIAQGWGDRIRWALEKIVKGCKVKYDLVHFQLTVNFAGLNKG